MLNIQYLYLLIFARFVSDVESFDNYTNFIVTNELQCMTSMSIEELLKIKKALNVISSVTNDSLSDNDVVNARMVTNYSDEDVKLRETINGNSQIIAPAPFIGGHFK